MPSIPWRDLDAVNLLGEEGVELVNGQALLFRSVAVTHGHGTLLECIKVDGDAKGRPYFIHPAVTPADSPRLVPEDVVTHLKLGVDLHRGV